MIDIKSLSTDLTHVNLALIEKKIADGMVDGISTEDYYNYVAETIATLSTNHYHYNYLAGRVRSEYLHSITTSNLSEYVDLASHLLHPDTAKIIKDNEDYFNDLLDYSKDYTYDNFAIATLMKAYLLRSPESASGERVLIERPQQMYLRVAVGTFGWDIEQVTNSYNMTSNRLLSLATPQLFNGGTKKPQMSSCFLLDINSDSIKGVYKTLADCADISQLSGGIGVAIQKIRGNGAYIKGTGGKSDGIIPMMKVFNETGRYVNQGGGKRKGSIAMYLEPHHSDIFDFLDVRKPHGAETQRARDIFTALWLNDTFMERVEKDQHWTLFKDSDILGALENCVGNEYKAKYEAFENEWRENVRVIRAQDLWFKITESAIESGLPYLLNKDAANHKSNQQNLGVIKSSNLCCVSGDQRVVTDKGIVTVKYLYDRGGKNVVAGLDKAREASEMFLPRPNAEMVEIVTKEGYKHKVTPDHKVWVVGSGWVEAQDLTNGDTLQMQNVGGMFGKVHSPKLATIAGLMSLGGEFGDGSVTVTMKCNDYGVDIQYCELVHEIIFSLVNDLEDVDVLSEYEKDGRYTFSSKVLSELLVEYGVTEQSRTTVPDYVWCGDEKTQYAYVSALMFCSDDGDGVEQEIKSVDQKFIQDIQIILLNVGVGSVIDFDGDIYTLTTKPFTKNQSTFSHLEKLPNEDAFCLTVDSELHAWTVNGFVTKNSEIIEYTSQDEVAVCNLATMILPQMVKDGYFDFDLLGDVARQAVRNLNSVIDVNYYPIPEAANSNFKHRPIGIGVQGLYDVFVKLGLPFESKEANALNKEIFACMYYNCMLESIEQAKINGRYTSFEGSPLSEGKFQFDLWNVEPSQNYDWEKLRADVMKHGARNSLLLTQPPTASSSHINNTMCESTECLTSNIYVRRILTGEFIVINKYLIDDLQKYGVWNDTVKQQLIADNGSIQNIDVIPQHIKNLYKTAWEISMKAIIDQAADRGVYICQSQSMNLFLEKPTNNSLTSMWFYAWKRGLKTMQYYLRSKAASSAIKFTVDQSEPKTVANDDDDISCVGCSA